MCTFFFFNDTATTEIYTLSLHDALPISTPEPAPPAIAVPVPFFEAHELAAHQGDRKSTRLNSSHSQISYAVFCLKKKKHSVPVLAHSSDGGCALLGKVSLIALHASPWKS